MAARRGFKQPPGAGRESSEAAMSQDTDPMDAIQSGAPLAVGQAPGGADPRPNLLGLAPEELRKALSLHFADRGQPAFRAEQIERWIFVDDAACFDGMSNLPRVERDALAGAFRLDEPDVDTVSISSDGTAKHLWRLRDGELIESVLIPTESRLTLCISSQAGCALGCTFCATGWAGFTRQLSVAEIVTQYRASSRWARQNGMGRVSNVVYMGMGEPMSNRGAVFPSLTILNQGYGVGARRITVSTVGVVPGILELAERPEQFGLALSLHSPDSGLRRELIPLEKRYPLGELKQALERFRRVRGRRITFEYTMIRGVNDDLSLAHGLAELAWDVRAFVNLIPFNPIPYQPEWRPSEPGRIQAFWKVLDERRVSVAIREPRGRDIDAACGQLRANALAGG